MNLIEILKEYFKENKDEDKFEVYLLDEIDNKYQIYKSNIEHYSTFILIGDNTNNDTLCLKPDGSLLNNKDCIIKPVNNSWEFYLQKYKLRACDKLKDVKSCYMLCSEYSVCSMGAYPTKFIKDKIELLYIFSCIRQFDSNIYGNMDSKNNISIGVNPNGVVLTNSHPSVIPWFNFDTEYHAKLFIEDNNDLLYKYFKDESDKID